jgi:hypothetical protein
MLLADGLLVWPFTQAAHGACGIVTRVDLTEAELTGSRVARVLGDLRDGRGGQLQILRKACESRHVTLSLCDVADV